MGFWSCECPWLVYSLGHSPPQLAFPSHTRNHHDTRSSRSSTALITATYQSSIESSTLYPTTTTDTDNMSSPATQYVYIPNLVGRQMLRIPIDEVEAEGHISIAASAPQPSSTPSYSRDPSPSPSVSSVEQDE